MSIHQTTYNGTAATTDLLDSVLYWETATPQRVRETLKREDVHKRNLWTETALHMAAMYAGVPEVINELISAGASLEARDTMGMTPLHWAVIGTAQACGIRKAKIVEILLRAGADIDARTHGESTALHLIYKYGGGQKDIVEMLIGRGADPEALDEQGKIPSDYELKDDDMEKEQDYERQDA